MPSIEVIRTAVPEHCILQSDFTASITEQWISDDSDALERVQRISRNAGVFSRFFCMPYGDILSLKGLEERASQFVCLGASLLTRAVGAALTDSRGENDMLSLTDYAYFISTSCSVPVIPSVDAMVLQHLNLPLTVKRIPIFQQGCAGGVVALSLAGQLARLGQPVIVGSVELCSLVFQGSDTTGVQSVGASIFADGAAAMVVNPTDKGLVIRHSRSVLLPESFHLMGYDLQDDGFYLRLDRALPSVLRDNVVTVVAQFLESISLSTADVDFWLFHPGGIRILDYLEDMLEVDADCCKWSRDVLRDYGNMSSATILYVLERFTSEIQMEPGQKALVLGIGPGLTVEMVLLEQVGDDFRY
jgi:alkylresorcinol/alkylpyrone synthase